MSEDSLELVPLEDWSDVQKEFKKDWPRGISGYTVLEEQRRWHQIGLSYGFKVFCPFGDKAAGMVAINEKNNFYEVIIQCPCDDTTKLKEALVNTNIIDWNRRIIVPFAPTHVVDCIKTVVEELDLKLELILPSESFILNKGTPLFPETSMHDDSNSTIDYLSEHHVDLVNNSWPHRYRNSEWYFQKLVQAQSGFGLFKDEQLVSWVFINEAGTLGHMFTLEEHRNKGYAELLLKHVCNILLKDDKYVFAFCVKGNVGACKLYGKVGFGKFNGVAWCYLNKN